MAVYREVALALRLLSPSGRILLHDYYPEGKPLVHKGDFISGPYLALNRVIRECPSIRVQPLGTLPWPTKNDSNVTSLALVVRRN